MKQLFYKVIYQPAVNFALRSANKVAAEIFPCVVKLPPSGKITIRDSMKRPVVLYTNQTNYLTHLLYWEGGAMQFEYTSIFVELIKKINCFYDIGANIGYYSLLAASENPSMKIVGFEPASGPLFYFRKNADVNHFSQIRIEPTALSDREGELTFFEIINKKYTFLEHNLAGESNAGSKTEGKNFVKVQVNSTTLDNYTAQHTELPDLIKMDTEGTEHIILQHAEKVLSKAKPVIICETLFQTIESELEQVMKKYNYLFFNHVENGLKQTQTLIRKEDNGVRNCFFVHPEKVHLIEEFIVS